MAVSYMKSLLESAAGVSGGDVNMESLLEPVEGLVGDDLKQAILGQVDAAQAAMEAAQGALKAKAKEGIEHLINLEVARKGYLSDKNGYFGEQALKEACEKTGWSEATVKSILEMEQSGFDELVGLVRSGLDKLAGEGGKGGRPWNGGDS